MRLWSLPYMNKRIQAPCLDIMLHLLYSNFDSLWRMAVGLINAYCTRYREDVLSPFTSQLCEWDISPPVRALRSDFILLSDRKSFWARPSTRSLTCFPPSVLLEITVRY